MKTTMSDREGNALFHSNGYSIFKMDGSVMSNGDGLNPVPLPSSYPFGPPFRYSMMSLPRPDHPDDYYLLHLEGGPDWWERRKLIISLISGISVNSPGEVLYKNKALFDKGHWLEYFLATKHANGRDWWIVLADSDSIGQSHIFYTFFLGADTAYLANTQQIPGYEPILPVWGNGVKQWTFSPDGNYLVATYVKAGFRLHAFDRCSGLLGPQVFVPYYGRGGIGISPNSRFIYVTDGYHVYQYDMQAADLANSEDTVATYDGFIDDFLGGQTPAYLGYPQPGPDGKIYLYGYTYLHYIAKPNKKGKDCTVIQHEIRMPTTPQSAFLFPNYRLGPLDSSPCDTLGLNNEPLADFWWFTDSTLAVEFADNSFYEPAQWYWDFGDGNVSPDTNPVHTFPSAGIYEVCLTVSNPYAADTVCKMVAVGVSATGQPENSVGEHRVRVFPNPAGDFLDIAYELPAPSGVFTLFDGLGRAVRSRPLGDKTGLIRLDVAALPPGFYFYRVEAGREYAGTGKVVIRR